VSAAQLSARWPLACFAVLGIFWGTWAALLPVLRVQAGASDGELGLALVGVGIGSLPAMILTGRLWRRARWWLVPATAFAFALATLGPIFATTPLALGVALVFVGASSGALDVSMNSAVSDVEAAGNRRLMYGAHALFSLGMLIGSITTGLARQAGAGPAEALPAVALLFAIVALGSVGPARRVTAGISLTRAETAVSPRALAVRLLATIAVLCALSFLIEDAIQNWSALLLEREIGSSPAIGGAGPGIFAGAMFVGRSSGQWLGARYTDRTLLSAGALMAAVGLVIAATAGSAPVALFGLTLGGAGVALVAPALFARAGRMADPRGRGAAIATLTTVGYTGFVVGPIIVGLVAQEAGLRVAFVALAVLALALSVGGAIVLRPVRSKVSFAVGEELLRTSRG
jgi:MFS family permease